MIEAKQFSLLALACAFAAGCATTATVSAPPETPKDAGKDGPGPAFADVPDATDAPPGSDAETLESSVTAVTVYSDRARLTREAVAEVGTEPLVFAFRKLPGWVDDGSVRVSASAGRLVDVRVERNFLARATDQKWREAEEENRDLADRMAAIADEIAILDAQKVQIEAIKAFSLDKISKDTTIGDISVQSYGDVLTFIGDSLRQTAKSRREAVRKQDEVRPEFEASQRKLDELRSLMQLEETTVYVTLQATRPTPSTVKLTYMMPGATWEPMHELRVSTSDSKEVEVISFAAVTQTSGEDWTGASISFSTQSTIESVRIPELEALTLGDTHSATRLLTSKITSFSRAQKAFEGQNQLWNKFHAKGRQASERMNFEQVYQSNMEYLQVVQSKTIQIFETLKNRGTTAHFQATGTQRVRGDGHPTRMRIGRSTLKSTQRIVAVPEQSLNAARTLEMVNTTGQSFLPGKVALYQDGAFLGMTDIDFIAQNERFSLFLSVADHIKLARTLDRKHSSVVHRKRSRMKVAFNVVVENLSDRATELILADRVPVSENREIRVSAVKITPSGDPDSRGLLKWNLELKPKEKRTFRISYQVDYPAELILDTRRKRRARPAMPSTSAAGLDSPYDFAPAEEYEIQEQLVDLEEML